MSELRLDRADVFQAKADPETPMAADLVIWDLEPGTWRNAKLPALRTGDLQDQLFVVDRQHVDEFLRKMPFGPGATVTKPVSQATLRSFVEQSAARSRAKQSNVRTIARNQPSESDRHDLLQCLLLANLRLQEYEQNRTNFLARAIHDFRAPLTAASGYCGLLREQVLGPLNSEQSDLLRRMELSLKKLARMASEIFELGVGKHRDRRTELKESSIEACVRCALQDVELWAGEKEDRGHFEINRRRGALISRTRSKSSKFW